MGAMGATGATGATRAPRGRPALSRRGVGRLAAAGAGSGLLAAAACAPGGQSAPPARGAAGTVRFKGYLPSEPVRQAYEAAMTVWEKTYPQITVEREFGDYSTFLTSMKAQVAAGTPPDVGQTDWGWLVDYALDNLLLPLDGFMRVDKVRSDEWFPGQMEYGRLNGKYYGLPVTGHANLLYYNRDLFQKAGVPLPPADHTWRWSDVLATAQRLTRRVPGSPQDSQWGLMVEYGLGTGVGDAIWQNGGTITDTRENPTRTTLDAKAREAIEWLVDLRHKHQVVPGVEEQRALPKHPFVLGQVGMLWGPSWAFYSTLVPIKDFWWDVSFIPRGPDGRQASTTLTNHLSAFRGARHPDAAWRLTYFFTAQEGLRQRVQVQSLMPAHKRTMDEVWLKASPAVRRQVLVDTLPWTRTIWKGRGFLDWNDAVGAALAKAWSGAASVSAAVQEAVDEGTRIIRERAERR